MRTHVVNSVFSFILQSCDVDIDVDDAVCFALDKIKWNLKIVQ